MGTCCLYLHNQKINITINGRVMVLLLESCKGLTIQLKSSHLYPQVGSGSSPSPEGR